MGGRTTFARVALPQSLSQTPTSCAEPDAFDPANDTGATAAAGGRAMTGMPPTSGQTALAALMHLLGREAAREFFLAPANDDAA